MKTTLGLIIAALTLTSLVGIGSAQDPYVPGAGYYPPYYPGNAPGYGYGYSHASTAGEGYARGLASIIRSIGEANLRNSQAAKNLTEAQSQYLDNRLEATQTYFEMRAMNDAYREEMRGPRATSEQLFRYAAERAPDRLKPQQLDPVSGAINWPTILRDDDYARELGLLERLFVIRAQKQHLDSDTYLTIQAIGNTLLETLKARIDNYPPMDYIEARKFVESLMYEARFPPA